MPVPARIKKMGPSKYRSNSFSFYGPPDEINFEVPDAFTRRKSRNHLGRRIIIAGAETFNYGSAGFRNTADKMTFIVHRTAYLAGLRARQLNQTVGLMITGSHTPASDNGVRLVDPDGSILDKEWQSFATGLAQTTDNQFIIAVRALELEILDSDEPHPEAKVVCAMDTRASGPHLMKAAEAGVTGIFDDVEFENRGVLTTPQLHYLTKCNNERKFGRPSEMGYYKKLANAFKNLWDITTEPDGSQYSNKLVLDCANGVGAPRFNDLLQLIGDGYLKVEIRNEDGELNMLCGAEFVKISQSLPANFTPSDQKCASFDGDADRLIYFIPSKDAVNLLDGDKIAVLLATYIQEQLENVNADLTFGMVQTAYANRKSSKYIEENLQVTPVIVPTGMVNLHNAALEYDVGVYFEANGHGTVVFSEKFDELIRNRSSENISIQRLQLISRVINEVSSDAFANLLAVEIVLKHYGWSIDEWRKIFYEDVPSIEIKVPVVDKSIFKTTPEETKLIDPVGIQPLIDTEVRRYPEARAFVRPSCMENIVRIYAEAETSKNCEQLGRTLEQFFRIF